LLITIKQRNRFNGLTPPKNSNGNSESTNACLYLVSVNANQILGVRPGAVHKVVGGKGPADVLFVRVPGGRGDKTVVESQHKGAG
jgi:hypothetical protein